MKKTKRLTGKQLASILAGFGKGTSIKALAARFKVTAPPIKRYYAKYAAGTMVLGADGTTVEVFPTTTTTPLTSTASL